MTNKNHFKITIGGFNNVRFEGCLGKVAAATGTVGNATPFEMDDMDELQLQLTQYGFDYGGRETLYNGVTGERYDVGIYFACVY